MILWTHTLWDIVIGFKKVCKFASLVVQGERMLTCYMCLTWWRDFPQVSPKLFNTKWLNPSSNPKLNLLSSDLEILISKLRLQKLKNQSQEGPTWEILLAPHFIMHMYLRASWVLSVLTLVHQTCKALRLQSRCVWQPQVCAHIGCHIWMAKGWLSEASDWFQVPDDVMIKKCFRCSRPTRFCGTHIFGAGWGPVCVCVCSCMSCIALLFLCYGNTSLAPNETVLR